MQVILVDPLPLVVDLKVRFLHFLGRSSLAAVAVHNW